MIKNRKKKVPMAISSRGGGGFGLVAGPLKKYFFAASLIDHNKTLKFNANKIFIGPHKCHSG